MIETTVQTTIFLISLIIKGVLIGILVSAPMGPVGVLSVQRTLNKGRWYGFVTGVGAACSDMIYAMITGVGMSFVSPLLSNERNLFWLQLIGSVLLFLFGVYTFRTHPQKNLRPVAATKGSLWYNFWTGFGVTFSNPLIIFLYIVLFASMAFVLSIPNMPALFSLVIALGSICGGALLWWLLLTWGIDKLREQFQVRGIVIMNRTLGVIVTLAAIAIFYLTVVKGQAIVPH